MKHVKYKKPLIFLISLIKKQALHTKKEMSNSPKDRTDYFSGKIMGCYSIVTIFKHQAFAFCIDQKELSLAEIDPQVDLLGLRRNTEIDPVEDNWAIDPMNDETIKGYLINSCMILKEQYIEAKKSLTEAEEIDKEYCKGELTAYHEVIATMKNQAPIFHIDEKDIGLSDIDPERDLL
ncbi:MAG: hypothetical protein H7A41_04820 [Chlamydiales bacterium]|nr:hypothetical protein [Chlamydiales bacterium]